MSKKIKNFRKKNRIFRIFPRNNPMLEQHKKEWSPGDEVNSVVGAWELDRHKGLMTQSDVIHSMHALMMGERNTLIAH